MVDYSKAVFGVWVNELSSPSPRPSPPGEGESADALDSSKLSVAILLIWNFWIERRQQQFTPLLTESIVSPSLGGEGWGEGEQIFFQTQHDLFCDLAGSVQEIFWPKKPKFGRAALLRRQRCGSNALQTERPQFFQKRSGGFAPDEQLFFHELH